jgi:hypothetical protein
VALVVATQHGAHGRLEHALRPRGRASLTLTLTPTCNLYPNPNPTPSPNPNPNPNPIPKPSPNLNREPNQVDASGVLVAPPPKYKSKSIVDNMFTLFAPFDITLWVCIVRGRARVRARVWARAGVGLGLG